MKFQQKQAGVGLIEVMVALLILSISLLSIASLQSRSLQFNQSAYWRTQANVASYDIIDRMRISRNDFAGYEYAFGAAPPVGDLADQVVSDWLNSINGIVPGIEGAIACGGEDGDPVIMCTVSVRWIESNIFGDVAADELDQEARTTFSYTTSI